MAWIKRNLFFLIGSLIAVALMVVGVFYLLSQLNAENQVTEDIQKLYADLTTLSNAKPHPGNDKIDNIKAAKEQQGTVRDYIKKERDFFERIAPIPDVPTNKVSSADFARELRNTVAQLRRTAQQQSIQLPPDYYFTFEAQKKPLNFDAGSLGQLAVHLGEVKVICDALFAAKINSLDSIQREIVSANQDNNPPDYLAQKTTVSTPLAELTPYQVTFRCFSADLALTLAKLATSPYGLMVQSINVEPVANNNTDTGGANPAGPSPTQPYFNPNSISAEQARADRAALYNRLGVGQQGQFQPPPAAAAAPPPPRTTTFLNEKPFRVTLLIQVVKLKSGVKPANKVRMEFLKKNYEKVLLGVVLLGLTVAVASLPIIISRTRAAVQAAADNQLNPRITALPGLDSQMEDAALQRIQSPFRLDYTTKHNLFNPVLWQKLADGRLVKLSSGNELGAGALVVTAINPLYLKLTFKSPTANGYFVTVEDQAAAPSKRAPHDTIVSKETKGDYNLIEIKGPAEKPTELVLEMKETSDRISLGPDKPFRQVAGYSADLKYPPEPGWIRNNQRVGASLNFASGTYNIVAITQSNVVVSAKSNDKRTTITFNSPNEPR